MISCSEAVKQLWEYLDGTVDEADRALIDDAYRHVPPTTAAVAHNRYLR